MSKRLITDRDVLEGRCGARIVLDGGTLITPAARDRALRLGIAVVEDGAGGPATSHLMGVPGGHAGQNGSAASGNIGSLGSGATCATCGGCGSCTCATGVAPQSLPDGLYLVRIEGGRAVSTLPAAGPGLMPRAQSHVSRS